VVNTTAPSFFDDLVAALEATGATIAFDATGGGKLQGQILHAMEAAAVKAMKVYSRYGSTTHKQVYVYGRLEPRPIELSPPGMAWGMGGWLLFPFLQKIGKDDAARLRARVVAELKTTFASHYTKTISLQDVLNLDNLRAYAKRATGEKYLINPNMPG
jgi:NADPH:quinone reductase